MRSSDSIPNEWILMSRALLPASVLIALVACSPGAPAPAAPMASRLTEEIATAEQAWARGIIDADTVALARLLAPEFALVGPNPDAPPFPRAAWMTNVGSKRVYTDSVAIDSLRVTGTGDSAVATLHYFWRPIVNGKQMPDDPTRLEDTWVRREGRWQAVRRRRLDEPRPRP
jgi:hypothetical protein